MPTTYTNDTLPSTSYANDSSVSIVLWDDIESLWDDANVSWDGAANPYTNDAEPTTLYTNDTQ